MSKSIPHHHLEARTHSHNQSETHSHRRITATLRSHRSLRAAEPKCLVFRKKGRANFRNGRRESDRTRTEKDRSRRGAQRLQRKAILLLSALSSTPPWLGSNLSVAIPEGTCVNP
ncbi:hypothetical protein M3J09_003661 [Ascochyta lentis]